MKVWVEFFFITYLFFYYQRPRVVASHAACFITCAPGVALFLCGVESVGVKEMAGGGGGAVAGRNPRAHPSTLFDPPRAS